MIWDMKIKATLKGATYLIKNLHMLYKKGFIWGISFFIKDSFINQPMKIAMSIPPKGWRIWTDINSIVFKKGLIDSPDESTTEKILKPVAVPIPITQHKIEITIADCFLVKNSSSARYATPGSRIEIEELKAAIDSKIKNIGPISWPNSIWLKADNRETNTKPGPLPGSRLKAKIIGNIARPARIATKAVSYTHLTLPTTPYV